ncbi:amylo-alpha-1,6-glucosidase [Chondromyces crocatus]|uniref:Glycogen debranching protein n=1 Tax=Chondromyces crocatus TaxID=52 RepID=A0A0K1EU63_CHOCO|nr:amylo-alpha-1,6-glucosidase [Chondromyces crocatus]AKT44163.1 glycogen debranching protein [Chondromyces crocatus]
MTSELPCRRVDLLGDAPGAGADPEHGEDPASAEWLVTNGLGGYASGTLAGLITRRFHGLLIAALPAPHGRTMMLNHLREVAHAPGERGHCGELVSLGAQSEPGAAHPDCGLAKLIEFKLDAGMPVWRYELPQGAILEKRLLMVHGQNTTHITYSLEGNASICLELQPWVNFRPHEGSLERPLDANYSLTIIAARYELTGDDDLPSLRLEFYGQPAGIRIDGKPIRDVHYRIERSRGYDASGDLYTPGLFRLELDPGSEVTLVASTESWEVIHALPPAEARRAEQERRKRLLLATEPALREGLAAELVLAADQFLITPAGRVADAARCRASGDEIRTVIAGYPWFTDWGRDTMISLEGLTLTTGRHKEAGYILRTFGKYVRDGLIPNMFPDNQNAGLYHTADATLWFFHAIDRYLATTGDDETLQILLPTLRDIIARHLAGTRFGIGVDPADGLLRQGQEGYQLTWMDAKVGDLVVTPRRGKAVELNALWYNALCLMGRWAECGGEDDETCDYLAHAERARAAFNARFWYAKGQHLYDVIDGEQGDDAAFRPNQLFAISLPHPILDRARWEPVVRQVKEKLLTPYGLRSLSPDHPDYRPSYFGNLRMRDMAYHQGTVWGWLIGPFVDAWLKVHPHARDEARGFVLALEPHLSEAGVGTISEIFDAEPPFVPRGCVAQAWSVAEALRCLAMTSNSGDGSERQDERTGRLASSSLIPPS